MNIEYLHASKYGNGAMVAEEFTKQMVAKGVTVNVHHIKSMSPKQLPPADLYLFSGLTPDLVISGNSLVAIEACTSNPSQAMTMTPIRQQAGGHRCPTIYRTRRASLSSRRARQCAASSSKRDAAGRANGICRAWPACRS